EKYSDCKIVKFSDGEWYMFTKKSASKENAVLKLNEKCGISPNDIIAFGDDFSDIGMLKLCGKGIAMGNSIEEVKNISDLVIDSNDNDGIAKYLERSL
ncbi:MAG: HAD hydrolase family protein, partial [Ruminiclostridium sp.]|nr:HAD hydrolase family protein [Ruminiclostridium sp.]